LGLLWFAVTVVTICKIFIYPDIDVRSTTVGGMGVGGDCNSIYVGILVEVILF
jgi:hypothetical protein